MHIDAGFNNGTSRVAPFLRLANSVVARIIWGVIQAHRLRAENLRVSFVHDLYIILCYMIILCYSGVILYYMMFYYILFYFICIYIFTILSDRYTDGWIDR